MLARPGIRRHRGALLGISIVLALGLGVAIASWEAATRTEQAYPSYLRGAEVGELVVNPSFNTDRAEEVIAATPGIRSYASDSLLTATPDRGEPRNQADVDRDAAAVRVSADGRYVDQDRPVVHQGRMTRDGAEAFVNVEMAEARGFRVGDTVPLAFWATSYASPGGTGPADLVEPFGRAEARIVGIGVFQDEVLIDDLYPRQRMLITPDVGSRFDCTPAHPAPDDTASVDELAARLAPSDCAASYEYFSLRVDGGDRGVAALAAALTERFADENERLPAALRADDIGFEVVPTVMADERRRVQRSLDPAVTALQLFGVAAAVSTLVVALLGAMRVARRHEHDARVWRDLGATRALRTAGIALPLAAASGAGLAGALGVGWLASGAGPVASARAVDPAGRLGLSAVVAVAVLGASAAILAVGVMLASRAGSRATSTPVTGATSRLSRAANRSASPSLTLGVRAAVAGAGGRALLAGSAAAVSAVLATVVFSDSLGGLVSNPDRFGWPYDIAATLNYGYGGTSDPDAIAATLDRPEVQRWGLASLSGGGLTVNGQTLPSVAGLSGFDAMRLPVVKGNLPVASDEIALGTKTAESLGVDVDSRVQVETAYGGREATVRGLVVLPPVGPFLSDRASLGTGVLLSASFFDEILLDAEREAGVETGSLSEGLAGFVAIDLRPGVDPEGFVAAISDQMSTWDGTGGRPFVYTEPVRPATVANVAAMRDVPVALAGLLALAMAIGLVLAIAVATRARRRELALLRALGGIGRQLRATVRWQALTVVGVGLVVGIPVGVALGRVAYRAFATGLGVPPDPLVPLGWIAVLVAATSGMGLLAAAGPGHRAARVAAGEALRHE